MISDTSPADQAILEGEYRKNPKPNKAARADIVEKVSLNEKEVQVSRRNQRGFDTVETRLSSHRHTNQYIDMVSKPTSNK